MTAADELGALLRGERPAPGLLQTIRLEAAGGEHYGEEAVLERCRAAPAALDDAEAIAAPGHLMMVAGDAAAVADLHGERVGRVWLLAGGDPAEPEPRVAVAFDPDLAQARGDVFLDPADHPALAGGHADLLAEAGRRLLDEAAAGEGAPAYRARAFLLRAWSEGPRACGLFAVHRLGPGPVRASGFSYAAALVDGASMRLVRDRAGEAARPLAHARL